MVFWVRRLHFCDREMWSQIEQEMAIVAQIEEEEAEMRRMYGDSFQVQSGEIEMRWKVELFDEERFCKLSLALLNDLLIYAQLL